MQKKKYFFYGFVILMHLLAGIFTGCTTAMRQQSKELPANPERGKNWALATIEYDDRGILFDRMQLTNTMKLIREKKTNGPVSLILFVHGWKHDASPNDKNRKDFKSFIENFASFGGPLVVTNSSANRDHAPQNYVGVYLAWRGNIYSGDNPYASWLPKQFSFWNRKRVAAEVAGVSTTEAILSVASETRLSRRKVAYDTSEVILIGHSFGGLILERAVNQAMLGSLLSRSVLAQPLYEEMLNRQDEVNWLNPIIDNRKESMVATNQEIDLLDKYTNRITGQIRSNKLSRIRFETNTLSLPMLEAGCSNLLSLWNTNFDAKTGCKIGAILELQVKFDWPTQTFLENHQYFTNSYFGIVSEPTNSKSFVNAITLSVDQIRDNLENLTNWWNSYSDDTQSSLLTAIADYASAGSNYFNVAISLRSQLTNYMEFQAISAKISSETTNLAAKTIEIENLRSNLAGLKRDQERDIERRNTNITSIANIRRILNRPPADLVLLVNPASESEEAQKMIDALGNPLIEEWSSNANDSVRPWIISISSKGDLATRFAFPIGQGLGSYNNKFRPYATSKGTNDFTTVKGSGKVGEVNVPTAEAINRKRDASEFYFYTHTAPQNDVLLSHRLICVQTNVNLGTNFFTTDIATWLLKTNLSKHTDLFNVTNQILVTDGRGTNFIYSLNPNLTNRMNLSGYWVVQAPRELIPSHNALFTKEFYAVAAGFYRICKLYDGVGDTNGISPSN